MKAITVLIVFVFLASVAGGFFVLKQEKQIFIENLTPINSSSPTPGVSSSTSGVNATLTSENLTPGVDGETPGVIDTIIRAQAKSSNVKGIYAGSVRNFESFKPLLDETELNALVIDIKESYGANLSPSLKNSISDLHKKDVWVIARIVLFRDSSLVEKNPEWYLATTTSVWQDGAGQHWLDPQNHEVQDYLIGFSREAIDFGFDELQFDYIRYPDDYEGISGKEKIKIIGDFFSKLSNSLRAYKPSIVLSADLFGYVATQFNSYGTGQRLIDAAKYFDYLSFMLYPSHFYGGFNAGGLFYTYPEVVKHPYDVVYYSIISAQDYLSFFGMRTQIRPWLQDFNLAVDSARGVSYDAGRIRFEIEAAQNATSSGWLLWNPSYIYTKEALGM